MTFDKNTNIHLLSKLFLKGITPDLLPKLQLHPELSRHITISEPPNKDHWDTWAAEHYHLFGMNVYPNAAMYLDDSGMLGGPITDELLSYYGQLEDFVFAEAEGPDHIGSELGFLSHISRATQQSERNASILDSFIKNHFAWWLPVFNHALELQGNPLYSTAGSLALKEVSLWLSANQKDMTPPVTVGKAAYPLNDPDTRLKDIARFLLTPAKSGMLITRDRIAAFGRKFRLPHGFGDRLQIMHNLFRTAVDYELLDELLNMIQAESAGWQDYYSGLIEKEPILKPVADFWLSRISNNQSLLVEMRMEID